MESESEKSSLKEPDKGPEPHVQELEEGPRGRRESQSSQTPSTETRRPKSKKRRTLDTVLRALGLTILLNPTDAEEQRPVLDRSRLQALSRCAIHIIPICGCVTIISLNFSSLYLGATLKEITALQFAAKLHEIFMISSITCIVFNYVRHKLTLGGGLPLGFSMAALETSHPGFLCSPDFSGALRSRDFSVRQKLQMVLVIVPAILLAAVVGPSSAVCMIPRTSFWPAGSTEVWVNATYNELYPTSIDAINVPASCTNTSIAAGMNGCPASAWQGLLNYIPFFNPGLGPRNSNWNATAVFGVDFLTIPLGVELASTHSIRSLYITVVDDNQGGSSDPLATIQPAALADVLVLTGSMWATLHDTLYGRWSSRLDSKHIVDIQQPFVGMTCNFNQTPIFGPNDTNALRFPAGMYMNRSMYYIPTFAISASDVWNTPGDISKPRILFGDLPTSEGFVNVSVGVVISEPRDPNNDTQLVLPCILSAGWANSKMTLSTGSNGQRGSAAVQSSTFSGLFEENYFKNYCFPSFPLVHINLTSTWANYINPFLPSQNTSIFGAMASLMNGGQISTGGYQEENNEAGIYTFLLTSLLANALSNTPQGISLQGNITVLPNGTANGSPWLFHNKNFFNLADTEEQGNFTRLRINSYVQGISYSPSGTTVKFAIAILLTYTVCALSHLVYSVTSGVSSTAWDSIIENVLLGIKSPESTLLGMVDGGVKNLAVFGLRVNIKKMRGGRLVWGFDDVGGGRINVGETYGSVSE